MLVDGRGPAAQHGVALHQLRRGEGPIHDVALAPGRELNGRPQGLVVLGLPTQCGGSRQAPANHLNDKALSLLVRAGDEPKPRLEFKFAGKGAAVGREGDAIGEFGEHMWYLCTARGLGGLNEDAAQRR